MTICFLPYGAHGLVGKYKKCIPGEIRCKFCIIGFYNKEPEGKKRQHKDSPAIYIPKSFRNSQKYSPNSYRNYKKEKQEKIDQFMEFMTLL